MSTVLHVSFQVSNLQTLACDLALAFSAQACKFTPSEQYIISTKLPLNWPGNKLNAVNSLPNMYFLGEKEDWVFPVSRWWAIAPSRYLGFTLNSKLALPETPQRGSHNSLGRHKCYTSLICDIESVRKEKHFSRLIQAESLKRPDRIIFTFTYTAKPQADVHCMCVKHSPVLSKQMRDRSCLWNPQRSERSRLFSSDRVWMKLSTG